MAGSMLFWSRGLVLGGIWGACGGGGCGLIYKTKGKDGKKGELVIMNSCEHKDEHEVTYSHSYMPMYGHGYGRRR